MYSTPLRGGDVIVILPTDETSSYVGDGVNEAALLCVRYCITLRIYNANRERFQHLESDDAFKRAKKKT